MSTTLSAVASKAPATSSKLLTSTAAVISKHATTSAATSSIVSGGSKASSAALSASSASSATPARVTQTVVKVITSFMSPQMSASASYNVTPTSGATPIATISGEPTVPTDSADFAWAYIYAHESAESDPTYRYAYLFWILLGSLLVIWAIAHHLRFTGGALGATYHRWGMKRGTVRYGPKKSGRSFVLPSNSYLVTMAVFVFVVVMLTFVGPDRIADTKRLWELKRSLEEAEIIKSSLHKDGINKSVWSLGNRFGFMVYALMPFVVAMALKSPPFAFLAIPWFTAIHWDKVGTYHRACGWLVWWMTTLHVVLWCVQLSHDHYNGRPVFFAMLIIYRFRSAIVAYVAMTLAMALSLRQVRNWSYEVFYASHVVLMFIMLVFALVHHYPIGYWIGAALFLWLGDRAYRMVRGMWVNGSFGEAKKVKRTNPALDAYMAKNGLGKPMDVPPGMAQAQILPSRTVRLSIRTPRPMTWAPGQSVLLKLPDLSIMQTHPFTISNNDPNEMVLVIKARKGMTRQLYSLVAAMTDAQVRSHEKRTSVIPQSVPVHIRASVDGPLGSAGGVRWTDFSNVVVMVGGSGVTFGLAITDFLATAMSSPEYNGKTKRVRFVWIVREYAEITWAASHMCRFRNLLNDMQLKIDIYVTNGENSSRPARRRTPAASLKTLLSRQKDYYELSDDGGQGAAGLVPPRPMFTHPHSSHDSILSNASETPRRSEDTDTIDPETGIAANQEAIKGLTNFEGEEDNDDADERRLSRVFQKEGKRRRATARKSLLAEAAKLVVPDVTTMPPTPATQPISLGSPSVPQRPALTPVPTGDVEMTHFLSVHSGAASSSTSLADTYSRLTAGSSTEKVTIEKAHFQTFERYDPYSVTNAVSPGLSPASSVEDLTMHYKSLTSRTQDMVLLDDTPDGAGHQCDGCGRHGEAQLWIDEGDYAAATILSENARTGRPPLASILEEEMRNAEGSTIVATCGPVGLNMAVRNLVSAAIDPAKIRAGDERGYVTMYSEDFEM